MMQIQTSVHKCQAFVLKGGQNDKDYIFCLFGNNICDISVGLVIDEHYLRIVKKLSRLAKKNFLFKF